MKSQYEISKNGSNIMTDKGRYVSSVGVVA